MRRLRDESPDDNQRLAILGELYDAGYQGAEDRAKYNIGPMPSPSAGSYQIRCGMYCAN